MIYSLMRLMCSKATPEKFPNAQRHVKEGGWGWMGVMYPLQILQHLDSTIFAVLSVIELQSVSECERQNALIV